MKSFKKLEYLIVGMFLAILAIGFGVIWMLFSLVVKGILIIALLVAIYYICKSLKKSS